MLSTLILFKSCEHGCAAIDPTSLSPSSEENCILAETFLSTTTYTAYRLLIAQRLRLGPDADARDRR